VSFFSIYLPYKFLFFSKKINLNKKLFLNFTKKKKQNKKTVLADGIIILFKTIIIKNKIF
jgi:hypothetical protein